MLQDQRIWLLISLRLSGEATMEELEELETLLKAEPDLLKKAEMLQKLWKASSHASTGEAEDAFDKHFQKLNSKLSDSANVSIGKIEAEDLPLSRKSSRKIYYKLWGGIMAASVLVFWFFVRSSEKVNQGLVNNIVSTKPGYKASINLPDGSKVWLNGNSKITYNGDFRGETREVHLSGEAFFDVAKDKERPFIIHTKTINLKVLGTAFNVRSYENDKETETALVHGSVEVTLRNNPDKKIVLKPGEKLLVKNSPDDTLLTHRNTEQNDEEEPIAILTKMHYYGNDSSTVETSWTKNQLVFYDERLDKIVLNLERWFNVKVIIRDESLKKGKYTATIEEEDKLEEVLEALKMTGGFHYSIKSKEVIITR